MAEQRRQASAIVEGEEETELTTTQLNDLVHYFGLDSSETPESLVEGIDVLVRLQRS
ncbi:MAG TPA: hypothetical protein VJP79_00900 [Nitrososphaera sp.]|nr:hypothetical protein [Nitrososphaera sp.]